MVELAVGGGLAAFLYWMQHKSSKRQREMWTQHQKRIYGRIAEVSEKLLNLNYRVVHDVSSKSTDKSKMNSLREELRNIMNADKEYIDNDMYKMMNDLLEGSHGFVHPPDLSVIVDKIKKNYDSLDS